MPVLRERDRAEVRKRLADIEQPARLVDLVRADGVEETEFPYLAQRYAVMGVPKTVANERTALNGMVPEAAFVEAVLAAVNRRGT
jgi:predicted DsbA family dithiol-disulfide isomerase